MSPAGFEPAIWAGERPQTYALDRAATGIGTFSLIYWILNILHVFDTVSNYRTSLTMYEAWHCATHLTSLTVCETYVTRLTLQFISTVRRCTEHFARVYKVWNIVTFDMHLVEQHGARAMSLHTKSKHLGTTCLTSPPPSHTVHMLNTSLQLLKMNTSPLFMNSIETSESNRSRSVSPGENPKAA